MKTSLAAAILGAMIGALLVATYALPTPGSSLSTTSVTPVAPVERQPEPVRIETPPDDSPSDVIPPAPAAETDATFAPNDPDNAERVQQRVEELRALSMNDDARSREIIWSDIFNPDKNIRFGAVEALMQFGDHSMAPRLRQVAVSTGDPAEKKHLLDAAEFLSLPRLGEANVRISDPPPP